MERKSMCLKTALYTKLFGRLVGNDELGNKYYESKNKRWFGKNNRWVIYESKNYIVANIEATWYKWLHYMTNETPMKLTKRYNWMIKSGITEYDKIRKSQVLYNGNYTVWNHKSTK